MRRSSSATPDQARTAKRERLLAAARAQNHDEGEEYFYGRHVQAAYSALLGMMCVVGVIDYVRGGTVYWLMVALVHASMAVGCYKSYRLQHERAPLVLAGIFTVGAVITAVAYYHG